jgi:DNA repair photolyase
MGRPQLTDEQAAASHERRNALTRDRMARYRRRLVEQRQAAARAKLRKPFVTIIYQPTNQAGEYSPLAINPYRGCGHGCAYCYVPRIPGQPNRVEFDAGAFPRPDFLERLRKDAAKYRDAGVTEQIMLTFTSDPYHPGDTLLTRQAIEVLVEHGLAFCTLTKGGTRALRDLDLFRPEHDAYAATLTTLDNEFSLKWERNAPVPANRILALKRFHKAGIFTWVSLEPTLDTDASIEIIRQTHSFIDLYKIGRANYLPQTKSLDWKDYTERVIEVLAKVGARAYIKKDLQPYLPTGYDNPLRVPQHH